MPELFTPKNFFLQILNLFFKFDHFLDVDFAVTSWPVSSVTLAATFLQLADPNVLYVFLSYLRYNIISIKPIVA